MSGCRPWAKPSRPAAAICPGSSMPICCRSALLLLLGGAAGDRYGRVRLLVLGTALFGAASVACALAPGLAWLLAGRGAQGVGAAILLPNSLAILGDAFSGEARG